MFFHGLLVHVLPDGVVTVVVVPDDDVVVGAASVVTDDCVEYDIVLYTNDTVYVYSVSGIRPDIITPPPILPSSIILGLSVTVTGVVPSMVV